MPHHHVLRTDGDAVLEIFLVLVEGVILIDILHVGRRLVRGIITFAPAVRVGRIALRIVDILVTPQDGGLHLVVVRAPKVVVVVVGGVVHDRVEDGRTHLALYLLQETLISLKGALLLVGEAIESHILQGPAAGSGGKGVGDRCLRGHLSPLGGDVALRTVYGHAALIEFLAVAQHVFAHLAEVDVEVAAILVAVGLLIGVDERVEEPELDILDVGSLEIVGIELAHHASPPA